MKLSTSICFKTERFDYTSELSEPINAGNLFYGEDVAQFLVKQLKANGLQVDCLDEDWGWLVFSLKGELPIFQIAIYNLAEYRGAAERGIAEWGLLIQAFEQRKVLGFISKKQEVPVSIEIRMAIESSLRAAGVAPEKWHDGPGSD